VTPVECNSEAATRIQLDIQTVIDAFDALIHTTRQATAFRALGKSENIGAIGTVAFVGADVVMIGSVTDYLSRKVARKEFQPEKNMAQQVGP
jgi:hypothetical protein